MLASRDEPPRLSPLTRCASVFWAVAPKIRLLFWIINPQTLPTNYSRTKICQFDSEPASAARGEHHFPGPGGGINGGSRPCGDALEAVSEASTGSYRTGLFKAVETEPGGEAAGARWIGAVTRPIIPATPERDLLRQPFSTWRCTRHLYGGRSCFYLRGRLMNRC